jgi:competence protein ComEC
MFAATTASWALQRPTSPWATLAVGALVPLLTDPGAVGDLGYQLSVAGFAALIAAGTWARRSWPARLSGVRRRLATEIAISILATAVTAPLVAWHFGRVSLIAPAANLLAAPIVAAMQPALFLAMVIAPWQAPAQVVADGARVLVHALDGVAALAAAVPGASVAVQPALATAVLAGVAAVGLCAAAAARAWEFRGVAVACGAFAGLVWWPALPITPRGLEVHMIDVGQGDAIALRTPRGRWIVVDAGGGRAARDAGRRIVLPYLRRWGGDVAMLVFTHPHDDHVGGAAALISRLRPGEVRDAAFAGTSPAYREALMATRVAGVPWRRIHPGDSVMVDGVALTFLAPDSAWTAGLRDPNLASAVMRARFGHVRVLLTGDAEAPEEEWLLSHARGELRAEVLKVAHHGSATSSGSAFLDAVAPTVALVSVGAGNRYGHPSPGVMAALAARGVAILRTDRAGSVVVATDTAGTAITARAVSGSSLFPARARP